MIEGIVIANLMPFRFSVQTHAHIIIIMKYKLLQLLATEARSVVRYSRTHGIIIICLQQIRICITLLHESTDKLFIFPQNNKIILIL